VTTTQPSDELARAQRLVGRVLGDKFKLRACIGIGGSGAVFKADQTTLGRTVAVKILAEQLAEDARLVRRFQDEALAASRLNHPNTVSVIDYGQAPDGLLYLVMEYVRGPTLTQLIASDFPLEHARVLDLVAQILAGVEEAHLAGVVHADLKSDNVIVDARRTGVDMVKVVDFGISRLVTVPRDGDDRNICGTPEYMAPEVITGAAPGFASDLYAVGVILYELLTGQTPFVGGTTIDVLTRQLKLEPRPPSARHPELDIGADLDALCLRALAKHPQDRFGSAGDMRAEALAAIARRRPRGDEVRCPACGASSAARFRFCPECGQPRATGEMAAVAAEPARTGDHDQILPGVPLGLVGRDDAVDHVTAYLSGARQAPALLVVGTPGADRGVLLHEAFSRVADGSDVTIFQTSGDPTGLASPFYPIRAVIAAVLALPPVCTYDELAAAIRGFGLGERDLPGIAELFGHRSDLWELEAPVRRRELIASTLRTLRVAGERGPTALVFEDVERYDQPSVEIVRRLVEGEGGPALRVVLSVDPDGAAQWPPALARVELDALDGEALGFIAAQLTRTGATGMPSALSLIDLTAGVPAHVEHLVRYLVEGGNLEAAPSALPDLVAARLSMLPHVSLVLLQSAAVFGLDADRDLLRHASGHDTPDAFEAALSGLLLRGLVRDHGDVVAFSSPLVRDVVYDSTPADVRRGLHGVVADVLGAVTSDPAILGHHQEHAGHLDRAAELLARAGDLAIHQLDESGASLLYGRAVRCARQAVYAGDDDDASVRRFVVLSVKLADSLRVRGEIALARGVLSEARSWCDGAAELEARISRASAEILVAEDDLPAATGSLRRAIGQALSGGGGELIAELYLDLSTVLMRAGNADAARRELEECLDLVTFGEGASARSGPAILWRVIMRLGQLADGANDPVRAVQLGECALMHARRVKSRLGGARVQSFLASVCDRAGHDTKASRYRAAAVDEMRRLGDRRGTAELLLAGTSPTRTLPRLSPQLDEAQILADEVGWTEGVRRATRGSGT
jgi:Protein kinase domain/AAA ATPase domain